MIGGPMTIGGVARRTGVSIKALRFQGARSSRSAVASES